MPGYKCMSARGRYEGGQEGDGGNDVRVGTQDPS